MYALKSVFNVLVTALILPRRCVAVFLCCNASAAASHLRAIDLFLVSDVYQGRAGLPPFVLTLDNAEGYFNPSSVIRNSAKHGVKAL